MNGRLYFRINQNQHAESAEKSGGGCGFYRECPGHGGRLPLYVGGWKPVRREPVGRMNNPAGLTNGLFDLAFDSTERNNVSASHLEIVATPDSKKWRHMPPMEFPLPTPAPKPNP